MIPDFNNVGLLPPYGYEGPQEIEDRSPYPSTLIDFVERFSTTPHRGDLLQGFINYRRSLRATGLTSGIQWIGGSFVEDCEEIRKRPPDDIDVVNFFYPFEDKDKWGELVGGNIELFDPGYNKREFNCDAYTYEINQNSIEYIAYYLTMFSHQRRTENWKGIVQLDFSEASENTAEKILQERRVAWL